MAKLFWNVFLGLCLALLMVMALPQPANASDAPAEYIGKFTCPAKYPGSFLDIGRQECWQCPAATPRRTIFAVNKGWACEKPAREVFKKASGPETPTGLIRTDCRKGYFLDIGRGKCYSCKGYNRSLFPVEHARACSIVRPLKKSTAIYKGKVGCGDGFQHFFSGNCYICPAGSYRNMNTGNDPSKFGACTACGKLNGKPCPVTTFRKSCDPGLKEVMFSTCVIDDSREGQIYNAALEKAQDLAPQLLTIIANTKTLADNPSVAEGIRAQNASAAGQAEQAVGVNPCVINEYQAWSLGGTVSAGFILGGTLETGMSVDIRERARTGAITQRAAYWYGAASYDVSLFAGASVGINYGCWLNENHNIAGPFEGAVFDPLGMSEINKAFALKDFSSVKEAFQTAGMSVELGIWFDPDTGDYTGFSLTPSYGKGIGLGGYVKGETGQVVEDGARNANTLSTAHSGRSGAVAACPVNAKSVSGSVTCSCTATAIKSGSIWGSETYTNDSSICKAARHAGTIPVSGGTVTVTTSPGLQSYQGSTRNGVTTKSYGPWKGSYRVK